MFERLFALARIESSNGAPGKEIEHGLLHVVDVTAVNRQPDERGSDTLGDRRNIMPRPPIIGMKIGVEHKTSAANDLNAVDRDLPFAHEIEHLEERQGVDADFLGRGSLPCV